MSSTLLSVLIVIFLLRNFHEIVKDRNRITNVATLQCDLFNKNNIDQMVGINKALQSNIKQYLISCIQYDRCIFTIRINLNLPKALQTKYVKMKRCSCVSNFLFAVFNLSLYFAFSKKALYLSFNFHYVQSC